MYTRKQYMEKAVTHQEYYGQFVNDSVLELVEWFIGKERILNSKDKHFNDIPLGEWDNLDVPVLRLVGQKINKANGSGSVSLSDTVCVAKAAAKMIRDKG